MTMLDDETLSALLHELGDSYAIPPSGMADTLRRVRRSEDERDEDGPTTKDGSTDAISDPARRARRPAPSERSSVPTSCSRSPPH